MVNIILKAIRYTDYTKICYYIFEKTEPRYKSRCLFIAFGNTQIIKRRRYIKFNIKFCFVKSV